LPVLRTVADSDYVKAEGCAGRMTTQLMAIACTRPGNQGKVYLAVERVPDAVPDESEIQRRIDRLCERMGLTAPNETIEARMTGGICLPYGLTDFGKLFTLRQTLCLLSFVAATRSALPKSSNRNATRNAPNARTFLAVMTDNYLISHLALCVWNFTGGRGVKNSFWAASSSDDLGLQ